MDELLKILQTNTLEERDTAARRLGRAAANVIDIVGNETSQALEVDAE
jgi:hypothetical protein